jgi:Na+-transporting methylmalonyl-CoA/oxaloacetate decarboxylase gamma subunit
MNERKRVFLLILIMATVSLLVSGSSITILYRTALDAQKVRLIETAQSQARLIEAVARFDADHSQDYQQGSVQATISQIIDAHEHYKGFGETGEFTLARREGENIVFLLSHRHHDLSKPKPVPFNSVLAEPMRQALKGRSGTLIGPDYRGKVVLAAHEPVAELNLGIVAKIDLSEIRAPFIKAAVMALLFTLVVVMIGAGWFIRITAPIIKGLEERNAQLAKINAEMERQMQERKRAQKALKKSERRYRYGVGGD